MRTRTLALWLLAASAGAETFGPERRVYAVLAVGDGDTLTVATERIIPARGADPCKTTPGRRTIRLLGAAAPEVKGPFGRKEEPFGLEAQSKLQQLLVGRSVWLEQERGAIKDRYGRHLAHVHRYPDGLLVNVTMVEEGLATVKTVSGSPKKYLARLRAAEAEARAAKRGVWSLP